MTSYTQSDYYFNEIDALSCNTRPISSTLRSKSTYNAYESQTEDDTTSYDLYGNQEYNDGSSCDSYNHQQRSISTMSNAGKYNISYYSNDCKQYCKNVITTDNLMYHRDACSGDSSDRYDIYSTLDYGDYDYLRSDCINYESTTGTDGNGRLFTSLGDSNNKMLPQVPPVQHSHSMWDGMYGSGQHRQSNVSLPSTPTFRYNDGSVGGREICSNNGDWDRGLIANSVKAQLNGHRHFDHNGGTFYIQKPPERKLPLPQSQPKTYLKKSLKQQFFQDNSDNMATTPTSMSTYRNQINVDYKKAMPISSSTQNLPAHNFYYDNGSLIDSQLNSRKTDYNNSSSTYESLYSIEPRPSTTNQLTDEYNDFGLNSIDNKTTYSDTTVHTAPAQVNQQKIQDMQKCRYSIIMAMTTASVIASGETRIPQHLLKKMPKTVVGIATDISTTNGQLTECSGAGVDSPLLFRYDDSSRFVGIERNNRNSNISGSNNLTTCAYTNVTTNPNQSLGDLSPVTLSTTSSSTMLLLSSAPPIVADSATSIVNSSESENTNINKTTATSSNAYSPSSLSLAKNLTSRKLPKQHSGRGIVASKQLPQSPQYPLNHAVSSKTLPTTPQLPLVSAADTLYNSNVSSSILSATSATFTSTTSSSISPKFSLLSYQCTSVPSNSFITTATKTDAICLAPATTAGHLVSNNNNNTNTDTKSYDNLNNYKNNNLFNNNVQTIDSKYCIESFPISKEEGTEERKEQEEPPYHLSTTPSKLNSITAINNTSSVPSHQFETGTAYGSFLSLLSSPAPTASEITEAITTTVSSLAKTSTSSVTTSQPNSIFDTDYKTSYDYADYLKPYTLPTFSTSNTSSNNASLQFTPTQSSSSSSYIPYPNLDIHSDYLTFSSSITTDTSTMLSTTLASSLAKTSTPTSASANTTSTDTTILVINNRGLNNKITALNLSDNNISHKSSISSPVSKCAGPSGSFVPITSEAKTATAVSSDVQTLLSSTSSNTLAIYLDHESKSTFTLPQQDDQEEKKEIQTSLGIKENTKESSSSSLYIDNYDNYLKDYNLDFISASSTSSTTITSSSTIHTSVTTASSSTLNKSWPISTITSSYAITTATEKITIEQNDNSSYTINNNEVVYSTTSALSSTPDCLFATTKTAASAPEHTPISTKDLLTTTAATSTPALYVDYLKDYNTVTASSSTSFGSKMTDKPSQELPAYITEFLITSKSNEYDSSDYLNLYKIKEETIRDTKSDNSFLTTTKNNNKISNNQSFRNDIPASTEDLKVTVSSGKAMPDEIRPTSMPSVTTYTTPVSITTLSPTQSAPTAKTGNQLNTNTALSMVDFDDNFYNSFSVNLNSLIADTAASAISTNTTTETNSSMTEAVSVSEIVSEITKLSCTSSAATSSLETLTAAPEYLNSHNTNKSLLHTSTDVFDDFYTTATTTAASAKAAVTTDAAISTMHSTVTSSKSSQASTQKPTTAGVKAANMLGGFSQSLKGGLDGVLAVAGSNEAQPQKRGFGFGLASKFVPSVGGLLGSVTKSTASSSTTITQPPKTVSSVPITTQNLQISEPHSDQAGSNYVTTTSAFETSTNFVTTSSNIDYYNNDTSANNVMTTANNNVMGFALTSHTNDIYGDEENSSGSLYYNSSQPTYYHMTSSLDYAQDEIANQSEQMMMYDDAVTGDINGLGKEYYADENQAIDMYDGYSGYEAVKTSGQLIDTSLANSSSIDTVPTSTVTSTAVTTQTPISMQLNNSPTVTAAKKATSSLFSSLTNVASQISQQTTTSVPTAVTAIPATCSSSSTSSTKPSSGGGMFGSIFGKAAAAMQTATQVVNQGATIASTKVQKNLQSPSAVSLIKRVPTTEEPSTCVAATETVTENNYQRSVMSHQNSLASPYASSLGGDDYDNSNNIPSNDVDFANDFEEEYYYANQNQPNQLIHQQSQQKLLPTVPPGGGSTGKKLPTINDKSGCLVKQQPTEIYEEDTEVLDNKSQPYLKRVPTYDIDSEQAHYYMDTQPVAPSARHMAANSYYEHTNGGSYDYRDDYFNEEDEFKYLEKEEIQGKDDVVYTSNQHQKHQLRQIHKQSSLQYIVDDDFQHGQNEVTYIDDMYHSEDSGNYLDESSSGSVKGLTNQKVPSTTTSTTLEDSQPQAKTATSALSTTTTTAAVTSVLHQQITKQDSIILEEDEKEDLSSIAGQHNTVASPSKSLSRKSSHDILNGEDDQMSDLHLVSTGLRSSHSRKMKLMRGETEEVVGGHMQIMKRKTEVTAKQRWHWAYNKIIMQLNVSRTLFKYLLFIQFICKSTYFKRIHVPLI